MSTNSSSSSVSWSSIAAKGRPANLVAALEKEHVEQQRKFKEAKMAKAKHEFEEREERRRRAKERADRLYVKSMREKYGVAKDNGIVEPGEFWYFRVEGLKPFDTPLAKSLRDDESNRHKFRNYLHEKYWRNWLCASEDTEDDCRYLCDLRWKTECDQIECERRMYEEFAKKEKAEREEEEEMERKLAAGEITETDLLAWKYAKVDELCELEDHIDWYEYNYEEQIERNAWIQRKRNRESNHAAL